MSDPVSAAALIIALFSGAASLMNTLHIRKCKSACCSSDCQNRQTTPPNSPHPTIPINMVEEYIKKFNKSENENEKDNKENETPKDS